MHAVVDRLEHELISGAVFGMVSNGLTALTSPGGPLLYGPGLVTLKGVDEDDFETS